MSESTGIKAGWKSTEFWLSLIAIIVGAVLASGFLEGTGLWEKLAGAVVLVLSSLGYTASRAKVKAAGGPQ